MYEHYERHRTDNITDPAVRRSQPISTISGWERERDDTTVEEASTIAATTPTSAALTATDAVATTTTATSTESAAITNGTDAIAANQKTRKVSKSEQTDESTPIELDTIKCACDDNDDDDDGDVDDELHDSTSEKAVKQAASSQSPAVEPAKNVSSISNISQVYNEQISGNVVICNGNGHVSASEDESSSQSPQKDVLSGSSVNVGATASTGTDALRQVLEIDTCEKEDESKEIVQELVEEILQKSESLLGDCQKTLERENILLNETETSSPVIKDDEIELAVSEVVKGVLDSKKDANSKQQLAEAAALAIGDSEKVDAAIPSIIPSDDNQKTDLALSSAIISNNNLNNNNLTANEFDYDVNDVDEGEAITISEDIVDEDDADNDSVKQLAENCDKANRNTSAVGVVNAAAATDIADIQLQPAGDTTTEDFVKSIVNEIVDKCVLHNEQEKERHANNINNNVVQPVAAAISAIAVNTTAASELVGQNEADENYNAKNALNSKSTSSDIVTDKIDTTSVPNESDETNKNVQTKTIDAKDDDNSQIEKNTIETSVQGDQPTKAKVSRSQSISTSTSTQVENNHFGKCSSQMVFISIEFATPLFNRHCYAALESCLALYRSKAFEFLCWCQWRSYDCTWWKMHFSNKQNPITCGLILFSYFSACLFIFVLKTKDNDPNQVQQEQCSVQVQLGHHSVYRNSSGPTFINDSCLTFYFHWKQIFK